MRPASWLVSLGLHLSLLTAVLGLLAWGQGPQRPQKLQIRFQVPSPPQAPSPRPEAPEEPASPAQVPQVNPSSDGASFLAQGSAPGQGSVSAGTTCAPTPVVEPRVDYPRQARRNGWEGVVLVQAQVDGKGRCLSAQVIQTSGHGVLDEAARTALLATVFHPALAAGQETEGQLTWKFTFKLEDSP